MHKPGRCINCAHHVRLCINRRGGSIMVDMISLTEAALRLGISWERAWRALLSGGLEGQKHNGRWYVTVRSVRRLQGAPQCPVSPTKENV